MKKDWIERELTMEIIVGVFILVILFVLGWFTIILSKETWFGDKKHLTVYFHDVMGLKSGDRVVVRGMSIGKVESLKLEDSKVAVKIILNSGTKLNMRSNYRIQIVSTSILGGRYLQIDEGSEFATPLSENSVIWGQDPYDLMADAAELVNAFRKAVVDGGVLDNIKDASSQLDQILKDINDGKGVLGELVKSDSSISTNLDASITSIRQIVDSINNGDGLLGALINDKDLYNDIVGVVNDVRATLDDWRETTPIVTFTSVFFGAF